MHYNTKTTLTFSFNFPLNCDSQTEAEDKIKDLISSGNIGLTLPTGYSNLELEDSEISIKPCNADSKSIIVATGFRR
ncbi:hypothetical protein Cylst_6384 (plasmid) [Cylindrospermum stagnale PCC 7417]|uniref:Uncharacterized protein n=1 Tax=Cylindrospermum stagnale PCC 7417 TaxID=56107 RepID=K9XAF4_9NOST|nr:hypothetical protein Cylst_6384 [Cylindrospermum stagnale PCC 7417]